MKILVHNYTLKLINNGYGIFFSIIPDNKWFYYFDTWSISHLKWLGQRILLNRPKNVYN